MGECLFLGGPFDGERRTVRYGTPVVRLAASVSPYCLQDHEYRLEILMAEGHKWSLYVHRNMSLSAATDSLVRRYPHPGETP
jgi:hypothetical protein